MLASEDKSKPTLPTADSLRDLPYLNIVVHESLRCFPPVSIGVARRLGKDVVVHGQPLPSGSLIAMSIWAIHYSTDAWGADAGRWRPSRWQEARSVNAAKKDVAGHMRWLPFTHGAQNCIGQHLAMVRLLCRPACSLPQNLANNGMMAFSSC